ncbi:SDR family NAD(P)-dependent oxidoreductase [Roseisalinus antarcticus]|uniref:Short chain dehydrogenase n=1 Tax=Roseisalinus antarcticus TaxID=254357 RepID=A0A1Y5T5R6_9RHOB|nr:SDR family NAD(P)-dependent oxidoreductase [Roseisalinus antarcticus]SLN56575.1 short chain dehydrogenase [Roseisalinus antarcticus]
MPTILITDAHRDPGLALATHYANDDWEVIAVNRAPLPPAAFVALGANVRELRFDPLSEASVRDVALRLRGRPIDVAILTGETAGEPGRPAEAVDPDHWRDLMLVNAWAPFRLIALLEDNLKAGAQKVVAMLSDPEAYLADYGTPRDYAYRASKASLHQLWRTLDMEFRAWGGVCPLLAPADAAEIAARVAAATPDEAARARL